MGGSVGTIFVELDLDDSKLSTKQKQILQASNEASLSMETNFKRLGGTTDAMYTAMRQAAQNAADAIVNSSKASTDEIRRAQEALSARVTSLNEQQFGAQTSLIESAKKNWVELSVVAYAAWEAANKAFDIADASAKYLEKMQLADAMAKGYGTTALKLTDDMQKAGEGLVSMSTAASVAMSGMAKGLTPEQLTNLSAAAVVLSKSMGVDVNQALTQVTDALEMNRQKSLKLAVGVIDLKTEYGSAADKITEVQKQQAFYNLVIEKATEISRLQGEQTKSTADKIEAMRVTVQNLNLELGVAFIRVASGVMSAFDYLSAGSMGLSSAFWKIVEAKDKLNAMLTWGDASKQWADAAHEAAQNAINDESEHNKYLAKAKDEYALLTASTAELTAAQTNQSGAELAAERARQQAAEAEKQRRAQAAKDAQEYAKIQSALLRSATEENKQAYESQFQAADHAYKMAQDSGENELAAVNAMYDTKENVLNEWYENQAAAITAHITDETKANAALAALYADYSKKWNDDENKRIEAGAGYAQKHIDTMASLYRTIDQYGADSVQADKDKIVQKYVNEAKYIDPSSGEWAILWQAYYKEINDLDIKANDNRQKSLQTYVTWSNDTRDKSLEMERTQNGERISMSADMWDKVAEYERLTGLTMTKDQYDYVDLMTKEYTDTFAGGVNAALIDMQDHALTWGQASYQTVNDFTTSGASTLSSFFKDAWAGNLKSASDYFDSFATDIVGKMADLVSQLIAQQAVLAAKDYLSGAISGISNYVGAFEEGTLNVPTTGNATVHEGEMILTKGLANEVRNYLTGDATAYLSTGGSLVAGAGGVIGGIIGSYFGNMIGGKTGGTIGGIGGSVAGIYGGAALAESLGLTSYGAATAGYTSSAVLPAYTAYSLTGTAPMAVDTSLAMGTTEAAAGTGEAGAGLAGAMTTWGPVPFLAAVGAAFELGKDMMQWGGGFDTYNQQFSTPQQAAWNYAIHGFMGADPNTPQEGVAAWFSEFETYLLNNGTPMYYAAAAANAAWANSSQLGIYDFKKFISDNYGVSLATGIDRVPYDNFRANLHQDETVLKKDEAAAYRAGKYGGNDGAAEITIHNHLIIDGKEITQLITKGIRAGDPELIKYIRKAAN